MFDFDRPVIREGASGGQAKQVTRRKAIGEHRSKQAIAKYLAGSTVGEIASELGVTHAMVSKYIKNARMQWAKEFAECAVALVNRELAQIDRLENEAWEQFEKSKQECRVTKTRKDSAGNVVSTEVTITERLADVGFANLIASLGDRRRQIMGLNAKPKDSTIEHTQIPLTQEQVEKEILARVAILKPTVPTVLGEAPAYKALPEEKKEDATLDEPTGTTGFIG